MCFCCCVHHTMVFYGQLLQQHLTKLSPNCRADGNTKSDVCKSTALLSCIRNPCITETQPEHLICWTSAQTTQEAQTTTQAAAAACTCKCSTAQHFRTQEQNNSLFSSSHPPAALLMQSTVLAWCKQNPQHLQFGASR